MTIRSLAQEKQALIACTFVGYEPNALGEAPMADLRRRRTMETADQRLDRLIELERQSRDRRTNAEDVRPEVRRLRVEEGSQQAIEGQAGDARALQAEAHHQDPVEDLVPLFAELSLDPTDQRQTVHRGDEMRVQHAWGAASQHDVGAGRNLALGGNLLNPPVPSMSQMEVHRAEFAEGALSRVAAERGHHSGLLQGRDYGVLEGFPRSQHGDEGHRSGQGLYRDQGRQDEVQSSVQVGGGGHDPGGAGEPAQELLRWPRNTLAWGILSELSEVGMGQPTSLVPTMGMTGPGIEIMNPGNRNDQERTGFDDSSRLEIRSNAAGTHPGEPPASRESEGNRMTGFSNGDVELEQIRQRVLRDAELAYHAEVRRLRGEDGGSYLTRHPVVIKERVRTCSDQGFWRSVEDCKLGQKVIQ